MEKITKILSVVALLCCLTLAWGRVCASDTTNQQNLLWSKSNAKGFSLLDPQRLKMYHSFSFSYFSGAKTSGSFGLYTTTLDYQISNPLSLTLSLNFLHQPLSVFGHKNLRTENRILPNFQLHYKPSNAFSLWINVLTFPPYYPGSERLWWDHER